MADFHTGWIQIFLLTESLFYFEYHFDNTYSLWFGFVNLQICTIVGVLRSFAFHSEGFFR